MTSTERAICMGLMVDGQSQPEWVESCLGDMIEGMSVKLVLERFN